MTDLEVFLLSANAVMLMCLLVSYYYVYRISKCSIVCTDNEEEKK
jgi:hypothetical protein